MLAHLYGLPKIDEAGAYRRASAPMQPMIPAARSFADERSHEVQLAAG